MRYRFAFCPNPDMVVVHTDKQIVTSIQMYHYPDTDVDVQSHLVRDLFGIEGVTSVTLNPYQITIGKGGVFGWNEMTSAILHCIQTNLEPNGEITEVKPPTKSYSAPANQPPMAASEEIIPDEDDERPQE